MKKRKKKKKFKVSISCCSPGIIYPSDLRNGQAARRKIVYDCCMLSCQKRVLQHWIILVPVKNLTVLRDQQQRRRRQAVNLIFSVEKKIWGLFSRFLSIVRLFRQQQKEEIASNNFKTRFLNYFPPPFRISLVCCEEIICRRLQRSCAAWPTLLHCEPSPFFCYFRPLFRCCAEPSVQVCLCFVCWVLLKRRK